MQENYPRITLPRASFIFPCPLPPKQLEYLRMNILRKLPEWQIQTEQFCNHWLKRFFPGMRETVQRWCWMLIYGLAGLCALGATAGVLMLIGVATAGFYFGIQENYFPRVDAAELSSPARIGERVGFAATELRSDVRLPLPSGRTLPAIQLGGEVADHVQAGDIRLNIKGAHVFWLSPWDNERAEALRREDLTEEELDFIDHHRFIPACTKGDFWVEGELTAPNEVRVKLVDNDCPTYDIVKRNCLLFISIFAVCSLCVYAGIWGVWWSVRSLLRHQKCGRLRPGIGLCLSALLHGSSLILLAYALGFAVYEFFLAQYCADFVPYHFQPELQLSLCAVGILLLQMAWFRLRKNN